LLLLTSAEGRLSLKKHESTAVKYHILKMKPQTPYIPKNESKIVTAASLFDGHDAAINIMRKIINRQVLR
jgi:hypothetical protein